MVARLSQSQFGLQLARLKLRPGNLKYPAQHYLTMFGKSQSDSEANEMELKNMIL